MVRAKHRHQKNTRHQQNPRLNPTVMKHEIYRAEVNGQPILRVSAEVPSWAPRPRVSSPWLRWMLAVTLHRFLVRV